MAKELPYFNFEPSEWLEGEIQICSDKAIVCFINLCSGYWLKLGCISYAFALHKYCMKDESVLQELINNNIISIVDDNISINFLDKQLNKFQETSKKRTKAANKRWNNASALQVQSKSNAIREDKSKEYNIKKENIKDINTRKREFYNSLIPFLNFYSKEMLKDFFDYWSEHGDRDKKFRKEKEKSFNLELRLKTWFKRSKDFKEKNIVPKKEKQNAGEIIKQRLGL